MISRLKLSGYKSIESFDQPLTPLTVLIGRNDTGKSTVLEALSLLGELSSSAFRDVFPEGKFPIGRAWRGGESRIAWHVEMDGSVESSLEEARAPRRKDETLTPASWRERECAACAPITPAVASLIRR